MTHAALREKIDHGIPFTIHVEDGRSYHVPHQDFIWLPPRSTIVVVADANDDPEQNATHTIPLLMVSGVSEKAVP